MHVSTVCVYVCFRNSVAACFEKTRAGQWLSLFDLVFLSPNEMMWLCSWKFTGQLTKVPSTCPNKLSSFLNPLIFLFETGCSWVSLRVRDLLEIEQRQPQPHAPLVRAKVHTVSFCFWNELNCETIMILVHHATDTDLLHLACKLNMRPRSALLQQLRRLTRTEHVRWQNFSSLTLVTLVSSNAATCCWTMHLICRTQALAKDAKQQVHVKASTSSSTHLLLKNIVWTNRHLIINIRCLQVQDLHS